MRKIQKFKSATFLFLLLAAFTCSFFLSLTSVLAQETQLQRVKSSQGFEETLQGIKKAVTEGGMMILSEVNQGEGLSMSGLKIQSTSLFIGNPNVGKEAFSADPGVGIVLPVRLNVYEEKGNTYINYFKPSAQLTVFEDDKINMVGQQLDKKLEVMTKMQAE